MNKKILQLAVPSIISNITVPLLGLVDVAITGHMGEARYMAAIAVGSMVFNIIYWMFSFLRFGTGGMTAQAYGRRGEARKECRNLFLKSQATCFLMAMALIVLQKPLFDLAMWIIEPDTRLIGIVHRYFNICIWGTLPSLSLYAFTGWFVGMQNTKLPMVISMTQNIVNICLSYAFVYWVGMKIEGVALGTLTAQWCGMFMALLMMRWRYAEIWRGVKITLEDVTEGLGRFFSVNRIIFYRTLFLVAVNLFFVQAGARGGAIILAVNSVLMQMFILYTYVMDGFAFAAEALCGRYYGAKDRHNFQLALKGIWLWGTALTILYTLAYAFGGNMFMSLLTNDSMIRFAAQEFLPWAIAIPFCGIAAFVWDGVFVGTTDTKGMLMGTFGGAVAFFLIYIFLYPYWNNHALWLAFNAYLFMRGTVQQVRWNISSGKWKETSGSSRSSNLNIQ